MPYGNAVQKRLASGGGAATQQAPMAPPPPPVTSNSSGQYAAGGGQAVSPPSSNVMGAMQEVGRPSTIAQGDGMGGNPGWGQQPIPRDHGTSHHVQHPGNNGGGNMAAFGMGMFHHMLNQANGNTHAQQQHHGGGHDNPYQGQYSGWGGNDPGGQHGGNGHGHHMSELQQYLAGDSVYQDQISSLMKELQDYKLSNQDQRHRLGEDFGLATSRMGDERTHAIDQMKNDYAARGLLNSSDFLDALGQYNTQYDQRLGDLSTDRQRNLHDLFESLGMYKTQNQNERQSARQEAIRRRTQALGGQG